MMLQGSTSRRRLLQSNLLKWFAANGRLLPWRRTRDPWSVFVSETMLQQTQVVRVIPKYWAFLERFPTVDACAASNAGDVIALWNGLGYNRRALGLHRTAVAVMQHHSGIFPNTIDELQRLPGIGPYTSRALLVFAFELPFAVVDTNVGRVLSRAIVGASIQTRGEVQSLADEWLVAESAWAWNSALLDIGATICMKRQVHCEVCPVQGQCLWRGDGEDPAHQTATRTRPQARFDGSNRQLRGRLIAALTRGPIAKADIAHVLDCADAARCEMVMSGLVQDRLIVTNGDVLQLP